LSHVVGLDEKHGRAKASRNGGGDPDSQFQQLPAPGQVDRVHWHTAWLPWHSLPDIRGQEPDFLSRITRMVEFHECFLKFEAKIRVICPCVTFVDPEMSGNESGTGVEITEDPEAGWLRGATDRVGTTQARIKTIMDTVFFITSLRFYLLTVGCHETLIRPALTWTCLEAEATTKKRSHGAFGYQKWCVAFSVWH
jgi:hypothetical protein